MIVIMLGQHCCLPTDVVQSSPSQKLGVSARTEFEQRAFACDRIQRLGRLLDLECMTVVGAQIALHRFYYRRSLTEFDARVVADACILLASKMEEDVRKIREIYACALLITELERRGLRGPTDGILKEIEFPPLSSDFFSQYKHQVTRAERHILKETGFLLSAAMVYPHSYILQYIHALCRQDHTIGQSTRERLAQLAWGYLNDSMRTSLCVERPPTLLATAALRLAFLDCGIELTETSRFVEVFDASWDDVEDATERILGLYEIPVPSYVPLCPDRFGESRPSQ